MSDECRCDIRFKGVCRRSDRCRVCAVLLASYLVDESERNLVTLVKIPGVLAYGAACILEPDFDLSCINRSIPDPEIIYNTSIVASGN